jgi:hypothetical protein
MKSRVGYFPSVKKEEGEEELDKDLDSNGSYENEDLPIFGGFYYGECGEVLDADDLMEILYESEIRHKVRQISRCDILPDHALLLDPHPVSTDVCGQHVSLAFYCLTL